VLTPDLFQGGGRWPVPEPLRQWKRELVSVAQHSANHPGIATRRLSPSRGDAQPESRELAIKGGEDKLETHRRANLGVHQIDNGDPRLQISVTEIAVTEIASPDKQPQAEGD